jgi:tetratricopeptide (TPR) repeat protein
VDASDSDNLAGTCVRRGTSWCLHWRGGIVNVLKLQLKWASNAPNTPGGVRLTSTRPESSAMLVPEIWGNVPQRNKNFTGRTQLLDGLRQRVTGEVTALVPHALHGMGGVGKTQLAIEYAYRFAPQYQVVWWIPADQVALVRASLAALAPRLGIEGLLPGRTEEAVAAVLDALRRGEPYDRWLLVFDNADQPETIRGLMPTGRGDIIITSRNRGWSEVADALEVDVFARPESKEFLARRIAGITDQDADRLAEEFGDLPLGLEQAAAWLVQTAMTVDAYLQLLAEEGGRVLGEYPATSDYPLPVAAAWSLSVTRLRTQTPYAMELLQCCAFFGAAPIPLELLERGRYILRSPLQGTLKDPILLGRAIRALGRYALVRIDNYRRTLEVHRIIQRLIRDELEKNTRFIIRHEVHMLLAAADPGDPDDVQNWPKYEDLLAHVGPSEVVECRTPEVRSLAQNIVRYLYVTGNYSSALTSADKALARWTEESGLDDPYVLTMTRLKIQVLQALARYKEAYELSTTTLDRMRAVLGEDHEETLILMNCHCIDLWARGEFADSLAFTKATLDRHEAVFGNDHPRTFAAMNNYAEDLELSGDYTAARKLHEQLYEEKLVMYGHDDHPRVLFTLGALGRTTLAEGDYAKAHEIAERAYNGFRGQVREHVLTDNHPWVLQQMVDLSTARCAIGAFSEALELAEDAHNRYQQAYLNADHPRTLAAAANLGRAQLLTEDLSSAVKILEDTSRRYQAVFSPDHPYALGCTVNLAIARQRLGDVEAANALLDATAEGLKRRLGPQHHHFLICMVDLATTVAELGDIPGAIRLDEETLSSLTNVLGQSHPHTLACAANLALDLRAAGQTQRADTLYAETIKRYRDRFGEDYPDVRPAIAGQRIDLGVDLHATF